jgi:hypothetical protein
LNLGRFLTIPSKDATTGAVLISKSRVLILSKGKKAEMVEFALIRGRSHETRTKYICILNMEIIEHENMKNYFRMENSLGKVTCPT